MFDSKEYKRSRSAYRWECTFEYFVTLMVTDSFLAQLLSSLGLSDSLIGIISSFVSLAFLFQLFAVPIVRNVTNTKRFAVLFHTVGQLCFMILYFIPFMNLGAGVNRVLACALILFGYFGNYFVSTTIYRWGNSFVQPEKRGSFSSKKEMLSLLTGVAVQLLAGYVVDYFIGLDNKEGAFLFIGISIFVFSASDLITLLLIKNEKKEKQEQREKIPFRAVLKNTLGNKNFRNVIIFTCLIRAAQYSITGFIGIYKTKDLLMSMTLIQVINIASHLIRSAISIPFGKYIDRTSFSKGMQLGMCICASSFFVLMFTTPDTWWLIIGYSILYNVSLAGINANIMNISYSYVDKAYFTEAFSILNAISGLVGFLCSLVCGQLLSLVQTNGLTVFGLDIYGQQLLAAIALFVAVIAILFNKFVISKQTIKKQ